MYHHQNLGTVGRGGEEDGNSTTSSPSNGGGITNSASVAHDDSVGERFYRATVERQRHGIVWEAQCGPPSAGWYEFRYFRGSGSQTLAAVSTIF